MKPRLILLVGIPGSGKSTLARILENRGFLILSSDAIRMELTGSESHMDELDAEVFRILHDRVRRSLSEHLDVIVDATNARRGVVSDAVMCEYAFYLNAEAPSDEEGLDKVYRVEGSGSIARLVIDLASGSEIVHGGDLPKRPNS
jgi:broad-specificity NMP kinase